MDVMGRKKGKKPQKMGNSCVQREESRERTSEVEDGEKKEHKRGEAS